MNVTLGIDGRSVSTPGHLCVFNRGAADLRRQQAAFLRPALESEREGVVLMGPVSVAETLYGYLGTDLGADLSKRREAGLIALAAGDADADQQLENVLRPIEAMLERGATLVRVFGRPRWGGPDWPLPEDFVWYESRLNASTAELPVIIVCAYDIFEMPGPGLILAGIQCHPTVVSDVFDEHNGLFETHIRNLQTRMVNFPWLTQVEPI
jgi:hypothetical protein